MRSADIAVLPKRVLLNQLADTIEICAFANIGKRDVRISKFAICSDASIDKPCMVYLDIEANMWRRADNNEPLT